MRTSVITKSVAVLIAKVLLILCIDVEKLIHKTKWNSHNVTYVYMHA